MVIWKRGECKICFTRELLGNLVKMMLFEQNRCFLFVYAVNICWVFLGKTIVKCYYAQPSKLPLLIYGSGSGYIDRKHIYIAYIGCEKHVSRCFSCYTIYIYVNIYKMVLGSVLMLIFVCQFGLVGLLNEYLIVLEKVANHNNPTAAFH